MPYSLLLQNNIPFSIIKQIYEFFFKMAYEFGWSLSAEALAAKAGGATGNRTPDLYNAIVVTYELTMIYGDLSSSIYLLISI